MEHDDYHAGYCPTYKETDGRTHRRSAKCRDFLDVMRSIRRKFGSNSSSIFVAITILYFL